MAKTPSLKIVLGVCGSIAAYKAAELVRALVKAGHEVRCALTPNAATFVAPLTLATLSRHRVYQKTDDPALWEMAHLSLASWADVVLLAPATADMISRLAHGRAEGLLDALVLSHTKRVVVCPAMDAEMWAHPATQANVARLKEYRYELWGPERGELASGKVGMGRLMEPAEIASRLSKAK